MPATHAQTVWETTDTRSVRQSERVCWEIASDLLGDLGLEIFRDRGNLGLVEIFER